MGMAASQARYLALTARKTNTEWEGQQINQARTALSNQSANLFNQMLTLSVPDCPDKTDYTTVQYSYSDGNNTSVLENWHQLSDSTADYNYIVDHYYNAEVYTGSKKLMSDAQVTIKNDSTSTATTATIGNVSYDSETKSYTYGSETYNDLSAYNYDTEMQNAILDLAKQGYISLNEYGTIDQSTLDSLRGYNDGNSYHFAKVDELTKATDKSNWTLKSGFFDLSEYNIKEQGDISKLSDENCTKIKNTLVEKGVDGISSSSTSDDIKTWLKDNLKDSEGNFYNSEYFKVDNTTHKASGVTASEAYTVPSVNDMTTTYTPKYVGNAKLTELGSSLSATDEAALSQIVKDCSDSSLSEYVHLNSDGSITYDGAGVYKFDWNGATKYTTYEDLVDSMSTPLSNDKPIDNQGKLATFEANYITKEVTETNKALLETDGNGRFKSVKFDDDSTTYTLNCEEVTDETAYNDAMNSYYHDVEVYEKKIADINAKTEVIQQQDRTLELRLKQLDTEQNALQTEMEAVKKVISKNVEMTFKTFSGS